MLTLAGSAAVYKSLRTCPVFERNGLVEARRDDDRPVLADTHACNNVPRARACLQIIRGSSVISRHRIAADDCSGAVIVGSNVNPAIVRAVAAIRSGSMLEGVDPEIRIALS